MMTPERWTRIKQLFQEALELPIAEREGFLKLRCDGDEGLHCEVARMLDDAEAANGFIETSALRHLAAEMAREEPSLVSQIIAHYQIEAELGAGGMGRVFKAKDERLKRHVAIKILPAEFTADPMRVRRFEQEAYAASALNHPCIITVYEIGQAELNGERLPYIAYELIEGQTLRQRLRQSRLSWPEVVTIAIQIAEALRAAHAAGIIHRDIKPENVMMRADGRVKVLDFGIAKRFDAPTNEDGQAHDGAQAFDNSTLTGGLMGTLGYLSPEQARMERVDARTDLFALGLMMHEMLAGRHPLADKSNDQKLAALVSEEEMSVIRHLRPDIPAALASLVEQALKKRREERYTSAEQMLETLNQLKPVVKTNPGEQQRGMQAVLRQQNANQLLNQFVALYAVEHGTRLSPAALWTIWRHSTIKRGRLESALLQRSLLSAMGKAGLIALLAGLVTVAFAAWNSVEEKWDEQPQPLRDGHSKAVRRAAFSPDGKLLATSGDDGKIIIWDFAKRQQLSVIPVQSGAYSALAFSPDGQWLAHSDGQAIVIRDANTPQKIIETLHGHQNPVNALSFSPNGKLLASGSSTEDRAIIWAVEGWHKLRDLPEADGYLGLLFYADSRRVIASDRIFDLLSGESRMIGQRSARALSPDNRLTIHLDPNGQTMFFDLAQHRLLSAERTHQFYGRAATFSHNGRLAVTGAKDIALWDVATHSVIARMEHTDNVWDLVFSPDDRWLVSTHGDGSILVWDMERRKLSADLAGHSDNVTSVAFSPSGRRIASASTDQSVNIWNVASRSKEVAITGYPAAISEVSFWDEDTVLTRDFDSNQTLRSITPRQEPPVNLPPNFADGDPLVSPDKRWLLRGTVIYDLSAQRVTFDLRSICNDARFGAAFSADSRWLVFASLRMQQLFLCEVGAWRVDEQVTLYGLLPIRLVFTPDGQRLITGCANGEVALWEVKPLRLNKVLGKHGNHVQAVAVSPDDIRAVSAGDDNAIAWWDLRRGKLVYKHLQSAPVLSVAFSPDGRRVVAGGQDKTVRIFTRHRSLWGWPIE